ncbi:MAG TPA: hypothetical protein VJA26_12325 [Gammaproteobacteria bacterium]|nr:hypothetical protein [Gammaproteobacteria bacterium]
MTARLLTLLKDQRSIDGIAFTAGMALAVAAYVYVNNRAEPPAEVETCVSVPHTASERGGQCYRYSPFARERTEKTK